MARCTIALLITLALGFLVGPLAAQAQQTGKLYRIGWLSAGPAPPEPTVQIQAFQHGLRDLGYVEGQNLVMEYRYAAGSAERLRDLTVAAEALKLSLHVVELRRAEELDDAFAAMTRAGVDALLVFAEPQLIMPLRGRIAALAAMSRLPAMYATKVYVEAGGLMSYGPSPLDINRRTAVYVDKILQGANPADLPVEQPTTFELVINLKTAEAMGLTIPPTLLFQATEVIR
jgi:ABC-type uncharacterized transport system substrate-binding protein